MRLHTRALIDITQSNAIGFIIFLVTYQFTTYIANDMIMPGMLSVVASFHAAESDIPTSLTAYILGGASLQLFLGPLSDRYGRRPVMIFGAAMFFMFTVLITCSHTMQQFLWARFFQGMGLCFITVIGYATLQEIFEAMDAVRLTALLSNIASLAPLLGPLAGALFIHFFHWRAIFIVIGLLAFFALWGLWRYMPESVGTARHDGSNIHRVSLQPKIILFNYKSLLLNKSYLFGAIALGMLGIPSVAWIAISPIMLMTSAKLTVLQYGLWQLPIFGAEILGNLFLRFASYRLSLNALILIGSAVASVGLIISPLLPWLFGPSFIWLMPGLMIYGLGLGITMAPLTRKILFSTPISKGTTSALVSMISMSLNAVGVQCTNFVYATHQNLNFGLFYLAICLAYIFSLFISFMCHKNVSVN